MPHSLKGKKDKKNKPKDRDKDGQVPTRLTVDAEKKDVHCHLCEVSCREVDIGQVLSDLCENLLHLSVDITSAFGQLIVGASTIFTGTTMTPRADIVIPALVALEQ